MSGLANSTLSAGLLGLVLALMAPLGVPAHAQGASTGAAPSRPWLDPTLLAAAKAEGSLIVYSSTNEQEGLPLFKLFTDATGIKVEYVRASDAILMSRMAIEFRADQKSYDIVQTATINKMPAQMLAAYEPPEAANISAGCPRSEQALVRCLRQLQFAGLQHREGQGLGAAEELRGVCPA